MKVLSAKTNMRVSEIALQKGNRYIASDHVAGAIAGATDGLVQIVADAHIYTRPWRGEPIAGRRLLIYRPLGIGDELITARLAAYCAGTLGAHVGLACHDCHHAFWSATPNLPFRLFSSVVAFEDWVGADYHVAGERWWESIATKDQPDTWGIIESVCNIRLPASEKIPLVPGVPEEARRKTEAFLAPWVAGRRIVLWQLAATSRIRSYPPAETRDTIRELLKLPDTVLVATGAPEQVEHYSLDEFKTDPRFQVYSGGIPGLIMLTEAAEASKGCVVCPDSVIGHIAAARPALPVVSLWSSFDPSRRVATYPNHRPIYRQIKCSPCWSHEMHGDPEYYSGCPLTSCNDYCAGLRTIPPGDIVKAVRDVMAIQA